MRWSVPTAVPLRWRTRTAGLQTTVKKGSFPRYCTNSPGCQPFVALSSSLRHSSSRPDVGQHSRLSPCSQQERPAGCPCSRSAVVVVPRSLASLDVSQHSRLSPAYSSIAPLDVRCRLMIFTLLTAILGILTAGTHRLSSVVTQQFAYWDPGRPQQCSSVVARCVGLLDPQSAFALFVVITAGVSLSGLQLVVASSIILFAAALGWTPSWLSPAIVAITLSVSSTGPPVSRHRSSSFSVRCLAHSPAGQHSSVFGGHHSRLRLKLSLSPSDIPVGTHRSSLFLAQSLAT